MQEEVEQRQCGTVEAVHIRVGEQSGVVPESAEALLGELTAHGPAACVSERLDAWDSVADIVMVGLPPGAPWPVLEATIRAAAVR